MDWQRFNAACAERGLDEHSLASYTAMAFAEPSRVLPTAMSELANSAGTHQRLNLSNIGRAYTDGIENAERIERAGAVLGKALHSLFCEGTDGSEKSARFCSLWNLIQAYFDDVVDEYEGLDLILERRVSAEKITLALESDPASCYSIFECAPDDHLLIQFVTLLCRYFFHDIAAFPGRRTQPEKYALLSDALQESHRTGLATAPNRFGRTVVPAVAGPQLRARMIEPMLASAYGVVLTSSGTGAIPFDGKVAELVAEFVRYIDDAIDLELDVSDGTWNSALTEFAIVSEAFDEHLPQHIGIFESRPLLQEASSFSIDRLFHVYDELRDRIANVRPDRLEVADVFLHLCYVHARASYSISV